MGSQITKNCKKSKNHFAKDNVKTEKNPSRLNVDERLPSTNPGGTAGPATLP